jgi:hypothetical protein
LINIGGNHAILGNCGHASSFPNGYNSTVESCYDDDRGLLRRLSENGTPILHFLNIRDISRKNEIEENGIDTHRSAVVYSESKVHPAAVIGSLLVIGVMMLTVRKLKMHL